MAEQQQTLRVKLVKSSVGRLKQHRACVRGLGLRKVGQVVEVADTPANRGMAERVSYLVEIQE